MYQMAGSTVIYQRLFGKQSVKEVVSILGPIDKEINVSVSALSLLCHINLCSFC